MPGKDRFGGIYSVLSRRDINRLETIWGDLEIYDGSIEELSLQEIADFASVMAEGLYDFSGAGVTLGDAELLRESRSNAAFARYIKNKIVKWAKRYNYPLETPVTKEGSRD